MIPLDTLSVFFLASVALALAPGPDNIFVLTQAAMYGRSAGVKVTLGLCTGLLAHTGAVTLGVAAIFQTSTLAFNILKILGAAYLLYLAWQAFRAVASELEKDQAPEVSGARLYGRGVVMNVTNPKVGIFFLAFLPQFVDPELGSVTLQILALGFLFMLATFIIFGIIAWSAGYLSDRLRRSPQVQIIINRVAGGIFLALALRLVTSQR